MPDVVPQSIEKTPTADTSVNKPASGTYGEKASLQRLRQELPMGAGGAPGGPGGPAPIGAAPIGGIPDTGGGRPTGSQMPPGVPGVLGHPSDRPDVPVYQQRVPSPGAGSPIRQDSSARDAQVALLMALKDDPRVSDATREWAATVLQMING